VLGARPLRRTIQREIEDHLSEKILFSELKAGQIVIVDTDGETGPEAKFTFKGVAKPAAVPDAPPEDITAKAATAAPISGPASGSAATGSSEAAG